MLFVGCGRDVSEKSRFTRPCLSGKEEGAAGKLQDLECMLQLRIIQIDLIRVIIQ